SISDWRNKPLSDAQTAFAAASLKIQVNQVFDDTIPSGKIVSTNPPAGSKVDRDSTVVVNVSKGPDLVPVPNVLGSMVTDANSVMKHPGLAVTNVCGHIDKRVTSTNPPTGTQVKRGTGVSLITS